MGVFVMGGTVQVRVRSVAWAATAVVLSVVCTLLVTQAWSVGAAPGDDDATFVPTAGCRLADTRPAPDTVGPRSTPLGAGDIYEVTVHGSNGECAGGLAIPSDAVAVALNVTAVNATASSNIRLYPANLTSVPLLSNLNVTAGAPPTPNKVDVKLSPDGKIRVYNYNGSVDIILDVVGYYIKTSLAELATQIAVLEASQPLTNSYRDGDLQVITSEPREMGRLAPLTLTPQGEPYFFTRMIVNYSISVEQDEAGVTVECQLTQHGGPVWDGTPVQRWQSVGVPGSVGHLSGTGSLGYWSDSPDGVALLCRHSGEGDPTIASDLEMTAVHLPDSSSWGS